MSESDEASEFDAALAQAVEDGIARGGLPGAAEAVRRGRRRSLRARGGAAVLGIAAIGGAVGVTAALGGAATGARPVAATGVTAGVTTSPTTGRSASAPTSATESAAVAAHGDGLLAPDLWPGYAEIHWTVQPMSPQGPVNAAESLVGTCSSDTGDPAVRQSFPVTGMAMWTNGPNHTSDAAEAIETVFSFADEKEAAAFLADARHAGTAPTCGTGLHASVFSQGVGTAYGVSWILHQKDSGVDESTGGQPLVAGAVGEPGGGPAHRNARRGLSRHG